MSNARPGPSTPTTSAARSGRRPCPPCPIGPGGTLPDAADVVVIGGGYAGINAARELARRGVAVTLLEAHTLGWGASTRNGGIVHAGYKWSAGQLIKRYGEETGTALYRETLDSYELVKQLIAEEAIDCDFREVGHLELAYAPSHVPELEHARESLASVGVDVDGRAARADPRGDRHRRLLRSPGRRGQRAPPPRALLRGAGRGGCSGRGRSARGRARAARSGARPTVGSSSRRSRGAILAGDVFVATNGYTDGVVPVAAPADHGHRLVHHRDASRCPRSWPASSRRRAARSSTRRTSCTTGTSRPTGG